MNHINTILTQEPVIIFATLTLSAAFTCCVLMYVHTVSCKFPLLYNIALLLLTTGITYALIITIYGDIAQNPTAYPACITMITAGLLLYIGAALYNRIKHGEIYPAYDGD